MLIDGTMYGGYVVCVRERGREKCINISTCIGAPISALLLPENSSIILLNNTAAFDILIAEVCREEDTDSKRAARSVEAHVAQALFQTDMHYICAYI